MTVFGPNDPRAVSRTGEWAVMRNGEIVHVEATKALAEEVMEVSQLNEPDALYLVVPVAR
jgi:hypothetical protein